MSFTHDLVRCQNAKQLLRIIFELIKGEMEYVKDLENIEVVRLSMQTTAVLRN